MWKLISIAAVGNAITLSSGRDPLTDIIKCINQYFKDKLEWEECLRSGNNFLQCEHKLPNLDCLEPAADFINQIPSVRIESQDKWLKKVQYEARKERRRLREKI